jgi:hypothetical protein
MHILLVTGGLNVPLRLSCIYFLCNALPCAVTNSAGLSSSITRSITVVAACLAGESLCINQVRRWVACTLAGACCAVSAPAGCS